MRQVFHQFQGMTLEDVQVHDFMEEPMSQVKAYLSDLEANRVSGRGMTIVGPSGVGKTMLASMALKEAEGKDYRIEAIEFSNFVKLVKEQFTLLALIKVAGDEDSIVEYASVKRHIRRIEGSTKQAIDFVLLDDIGREYESASGWSDGELFDLLRTRYNRGLPFFVTSNNSMAELRDRYTEGMVSLLTEATEVIHIGGEDRRMLDSKWWRDETRAARD